MLLLPALLHCLLMSKLVRFLRLLAIAMVPEYPMWLLSELLYYLLMFKTVRFFKFYTMNCAPLCPTSKFKNEFIPFELILSVFTCGSYISSTFSFCIVLSVLSTASNPLMVKVLLSSSAFSPELPRRNSLSY
jgi:hypothetical protein